MLVEVQATVIPHCMSYGALSRNADHIGAITIACGVKCRHQTCSDMQGFPDLLWEGSFPENTTAAPVVKAFCCHYSLSQEACQLYCSDLPMAQEDALLQVQTGPS